MIYLKDVDRGNYEECLTLDVSGDQRSFVATNLRSLAQAYVFQDVAKPYAIYDDDVMVGFAMFHVDSAKGEYWLWRFMIDKRHQNKGYGKAAMGAIINHFASIGAKAVKLCFEPDNHVAEKLYTKCGFYRNGEMEDDEIVMQLDL